MRLFQLGTTLCTCVQQYTFKFKTREEDPSLMNIFQKRNFKLLVDLIEQGTSCYEEDGSGQKRQCDKEPTTREERPFYNRQTAYFGQCIFQDQPRVTLSFKA